MPDCGGAPARGANPGHYALVCPSCGRATEDDGLMLHCVEPHEAALLSTRYVKQPFRPVTSASGLDRYREWLPFLNIADASYWNVELDGE